MMQQYREAKDAAPRHAPALPHGRLLRAVRRRRRDSLPRVLGLTLTSRDKADPDGRLPAPRSSNSYLRKLLHAGHRVAVCDQVEDAGPGQGARPPRGHPRRHAGHRHRGRPARPAPAEPPRRRASAGAAAPSAWPGSSSRPAQFQAADVPPDRLADELARLGPGRVPAAPRRDAGRLGRRLARPRRRRPLTPRPDWTFDADDRPAARCCDHFGVAHARRLRLRRRPARACVAAGALVLYLQETLKAEPGAPAAGCSRTAPDAFLLLDEVTRRSLELTRTLRDGEPRGLAARACSTAPSRRWAPGCCTTGCSRRSPTAPAIEARLDAVAELLDDHAPARRAARAARRGARPAAADGARQHRPGDAARPGRRRPHAAAAAAAQGEARRPQGAAARASWKARLELCPDLREALDAALVDDPPLTRQGGRRHPRRLRRRARRAARRSPSGGKEWIARFQAEEIARTGIASLKVGFNQVFGYYIEITHAHAGEGPGRLSAASRRSRTPSATSRRS